MQKFPELSSLSYSNMRLQLYAYNVITMQEKMEIDHLVENSKMEKITDIIITSLQCNLTAKYKGFLLAMESSGDPLLKAMAQELGESILSQLLLHIYAYFT